MGHLLDYLENVLEDPEFQYDFNLGDDLEINFTWLLNRPLVLTKLIKDYKEDIIHDINLELNDGENVDYLLNSLKTLKNIYYGF